MSDHFSPFWQNPPSHIILYPQKWHCISNSVLLLFNQISDLDMMFPICCIDYWPHKCIILGRDTEKPHNKEIDCM